MNMPTPYIAWKNPIAVACFDLSMDFMHKDIRSGNTRPRPNPPMICDKYNMLILLISGIAAQDADIITKPAAITFFSPKRFEKTEPLTAEENIAGKDENAVRSPSCASFAPIFFAITGVNHILLKSYKLKKDSQSRNNEQAPVSGNCKQFRDIERLSVCFLFQQFQTQSKP